MAAHHDDDEEESEEDEDDGDYEDENEPVKPVPRAKRSSGKRAKERRMTLLDDQSS